MNANTTDPDILLIGLDSMDPKTIQDMVGRGKLPHLGRLLAEGRTVDTLAPVGVYVSALWPTIYTGRNPAVHGHYCWKQWVPGTYDFKGYRPGKHMLAETFWQGLNVVNDSCRNGDHVPEGLIICADSDLAEAFGPQRVPAEAIMPTVCRLLGVDWPSSTSSDIEAVA